MKANQAFYKVATMCRVLEVSTSGYYTWLKRPLSARAQADVALTERIVKIHKCSDGTYGVPRIYEELVAEGERIGRKRVARLMRAAGLEGVSRRKRHRTTYRDRDGRVAADLVNRDFTANGPDQLWVADITYISTWAGFLYLAVVVDAWSRRVVGWAMATHLLRRAGARGVEYGALATTAGSRHPSLRPGMSVHLHCLRSTVPQGRCPALYGLHR